MRGRGGPSSPGNNPWPEKASGWSPSPRPATVSSSHQHQRSARRSTTQVAAGRFRQRPGAAGWSSNRRSISGTVPAARTAADLHRTPVHHFQRPRRDVVGVAPALATTSARISSPMSSTMQHGGQQPGDRRSSSPSVSPPNVEGYARGSRPRTDFVPSKIRLAMALSALSIGARHGTIGWRWRRPLPAWPRQPSAASTMAKAAIRRRLLRLVRRLNGGNDALPLFLGAGQQLLDAFLAERMGMQARAPATGARR